MKNYLKYLLFNNYKLLIVLSILFIIFHPLVYLAQMVNTPDYFQTYLTFSSIRAYSSLAIIMLVILVIVMPIIIQRKQMSGNGSDLIYSFPMRREKRLFTEILYGWIMIFVPFIVSCILLLLCNEVLVMYSLIQFSTLFLYCIVILSAWYLFNVLITNKCHSTRDAIIVEVLYLFVFLLLFMQISSFFYNNSISSEVAYSMASKVSYITDYISPIGALIAPNYDLNNLSTAGVYLIYCFILMWFIRKSSLSKQAEKSGGTSDSKVLYPFALSLIVFISLISSAGSLQSIGSIIRLYVFLIVCYLGINFIAQRNFKIRVRHILLFVFSIIASYSFRFIYLQTGCFNEAYAYKKYNSVVDVNKVYIEYYEDNNKDGYNNDVYYVLGEKDTLNNVFEVSQKVQDYLVKEYKKRGNVNLYNDFNNRITVSYIPMDNNVSDTQKFTYNIDKRMKMEIENMLKRKNIEIIKKK